MGAVSENVKLVDVICQHTRKASIIPIRVRIEDEDGIFHEYTIKGYAEKPHASNALTQHGIRTHSHIWTFFCKIQVIDKMRTIELSYNANDNLWRLVRIL